jgi:hypothetical protein
MIKIIASPEIRPFLPNLQPRAFCLFYGLVKSLKVVYDNPTNGRFGPFIAKRWQRMQALLLGLVPSPGRCNVSWCELTTGIVLSLLLTPVEPVTDDFMIPD